MTRQHKPILASILFVLTLLGGTGLAHAVTYNLTLVKAGTGLGTVTGSPAGINCGGTCIAPYTASTSVVLTETPALGSTFQGWSGACTGTATTCTVVMGSAKTVTATFTAVPVTLTVARTGAGFGTVSSSLGNSLNCGTTCSVTVNQYSKVTLTATPEDGTQFVRWLGGCTGTESSCTLSMEQNTAVQAEFSTPYVFTYQYDPNGNLTQITDPLNQVTQQAFDRLVRPSQTLEPHPDQPGTTLGQIDTDYDDQGAVARLTDPRNLSTDYQRNAFGDLLSLTSPDTGVMTFIYDDAGNLKSHSDARSETATYTYDAQNRVTRIAYDDQTFDYGWDNCPNGIGRLCSLNSGDSQLTFTYDLHGRTTQQSQTTGTATLSLGTHYTTNGQRDQLTMPSGQQIAYTWQNGQVTAIGVNGQPLIGQIVYEPDGQVGGWVWGNNEPAQRRYDLTGRPILIDFGRDSQSQQPETLHYSYDPAGRLTDIHREIDTAADRQYRYDGLDRLTASTQGIPSQNADSYRYDLSGNRTAAQHASTADNYSVDPGSNRLQSVSGSTNKTYHYDAAGHVTGDGTYLHIYNAAGRRSATTGPGLTASYGYNGFGQRIQKTVNGVTTRFVYDSEGHLLGEYDSTGQLIQEFVWFGHLPIAVLKPAPAPGTGIEVFYVHADHLGTPRKISRPSDNQVLWTWDGEAFGNSAPNQNPTGQGDFVFNLRFPGQYADAETGLNYNYFRDYDPATGRYAQSDPIGLAGGINTYAYVSGTPVNLSDPLGLEPYKPYPNMNSAACDASCEARKLPQNREYGSLIYPCDNGGFCYTPPIYNPDPQFPKTTWEPDKSQLPAGSADPCGDIHTHWRAPGYQRTWNKIHDGDRVSNWILTPPRTAYVATPDRGLLRYDPLAYPSSPGSGPVNPVSCSCETRQQ